MHDFLAASQQWISHYSQLPGRRVKITTMTDALPEVFWVLGQEGRYLVLAQEPHIGEQGKRRFTVLDAGSIRTFDLLEQGPDPEVKPVEHESVNLFDPAVMLFAQARVAVHALTPSGSRSHVEVTGVEPVYGGYFVSPNHALGFALRHLHLELKDAGLVAPAELPLRQDWWDIPSKSMTAPLPPEASPAASLSVFILETRSDQLAGVTLPRASKGLSKGLNSTARVRAWGYEALCQEAINRRLLPSDFKPRIRRNHLS